jgi:hypothetical protein
MVAELAAETSAVEQFLHRRYDDLSDRLDMPGRARSPPRCASLARLYGMIAETTGYLMSET